MANKGMNKTLTRSLVTLGTICAGAVIWGSVSGQFQSTPLVAQEYTAPIADTTAASGVILDSTMTPTLVPTSPALASLIQTPPAANVPAPTVAVPAATTAPASQPVGTAPPATTAAKPAVTAAPPVTVQVVPKLKTRGS
jgi:hypothetical protein